MAIDPINFARTTQVRLRRGTAGQIAANPPVEAEPFYDLTSQRMGVGGGSDGIVEQWKSQFLEHTADDADAVPRNLQEKLTEIVSVKDFGAVGDGVTDDTSAIQKAIDTGRNVTFPDGEYLVSGTLEFQTDFQQVDFRNQLIVVSSGFVGNEVFKVGYKPGGTFTTNYSFRNLNMRFDTLGNIYVFSVSNLARSSFIDCIVLDSTGGFFNPASGGFDITCINIYIRSSQVYNAAGFYVNFTDSRFYDIKPVGFSRYGIVNDGQDNSYHGCHAWSYLKTQPGFTNFSTEILYYDKEDGMWNSCYADTFQRLDPLQPPSFANGGIAWYFDKTSGNATLTDCGIYSPDTDTDSLIGVAADTVVQQLNLVNCRIVGSNFSVTQDAYQYFVYKVGTAVNMFGCNFNETEFQAKELLLYSDLVASREAYIKTLDASQFNTLNSSLQTFKSRRNDYSLLTFRNDGSTVRAYMWDRLIGAKGTLQELIKRSDSIHTYTSLTPLGIVDGDYTNPATAKADFCKDIIDAVTAQNRYPCRIVVRIDNTRPNILANVVPFACVLDCAITNQNTFVLTARRFNASVAPQNAAYEYYNNTFHAWA